MSRQFERAVLGATRTDWLSMTRCRVAPSDTLNTRTTRAFAGYRLALSSAAPTGGPRTTRGSREGSWAPPCIGSLRLVQMVRRLPVVESQSVPGNLRSGVIHNLHAQHGLTAWPTNQPLTRARSIGTAPEVSAVRRTRMTSQWT